MTWEGIRNIINISKKNNAFPTKLIYNNATFTSKDKMAEAYNNFLSILGTKLTKKFPKARKLKRYRPKFNFLNFC